MKRLFVIIAALLSVYVADAQIKEFFLGKPKAELDATEWADINTSAFYRLDARSNIVAYSDENDIESRNYEQSPFYVSLNGDWKMRLEKGCNSIGENLDAKTFSTEGWNLVSVPDSRWFKNGLPLQMPKITSPSELPSTNNYVATYYKEFNVTKSWSDYDAILRLQARSAYYVWVNNMYVGYAEDSRSISEFDITEFLKYGKTNNIILQVVGVSTGSLLEMNIPSTFAGITGDAAIVLEPKVHVLDYQLKHDYEARSGIGDFGMTINVANKNAKGKYYVEVELWNPAGKAIEKMGKWVVFDKKNEVKCKLEREILQAQPWNENNPTMYTVVVRLRNEAMEVIETIGTRFGFRHVEMQDGVLTLNGKEIALRGVVYNNYMYSNGTQLTREQIKKDLQLMKQNNINAVRTRLLSPAADYLYELCDEYGMYVVCDANLTSFSGMGKAVSTDNEYSDLFVDRVKRMHAHYKNYTSILAWSLGDGAGNGICMEGAYKTLKQLDKERPVIYAGAEFSANTDMIATRSTDIDVMKQCLAKQTTRPMILIGYQAAQGNGFGGLEPMWQLVRNNRRMLGGFMQNWNEVMAYNQESGADVAEGGVVNRSGKMSPVLSELRELYREFDVKVVNVGPDAYEFNITNYSNFSKLSDYQVEYNICSNLKPRIIEGDVNVSLEPGESKNFKLKIPKLTLYSGEDMYIRFTVKQKHATALIPKGTVMSNMSFDVPMYSKARQAMPEYDKVPLTLAAQDRAGLSADQMGVITVQNQNFELQYDLDKAELVSYKVDEREVLKSSVDFNFWREPTDNDIQDKNAYRLWQSLQNLKKEVVAANYRQIDNYNVGIDIMLRYTDQSGSTMMDIKQTIQIIYTGDVIFNNEIVASELVKGLPRVGMQFVANKDMDMAEWYGMQNETYADRKQSGLLGMNSKPVAEMGYDYGNGQENGNRTDSRWAALNNGKQGLFVDMLDSVFDFSVHPDAKGTRVMVDYKAAGIGSATSGSPIGEKYLLKNKKYNFRVHLRSYRCLDNDARDFCLIEYPSMQSGVLPMPVISKNRERFDAPMQITMRTDAAKAEIRYTLDGSVPTEKSMLYRSPITINSSTVVKARTYRKGATTSFTTTQVYNYDYISSIEYSTKPNTPYNYKAESALFDGETGTVNDLSRGWIGFSGSDFSAVLELGKSIELDQVVLRFAHVPDAWVFAPKAVDVYTSEDGKNFDKHFVATIPYDPADQEMNSSQLQTIKVNINQKNVKYVKVVAHNMGKVPKWHKAKGLNAWIMIDEIQLNEMIK